ncbi:MAG: hypothetical protein AVDCRST_MAG59-3340, partial [uncultured Thermomicrobiales bacterium]
GTGPGMPSLGRLVARPDRDRAAGGRAAAPAGPGWPVDPCRRARRPLRLRRLLPRRSPRLGPGCLAAPRRHRPLDRAGPPRPDGRRSALSDAAPDRSPRFRPRPPVERPLDPRVGHRLERRRLRPRHQRVRPDGPPLPGDPGPTGGARGGGRHRARGLGDRALRLHWRLLPRPRSQRPGAAPATWSSPGHRRRRTAHARPGCLPRRRLQPRTRTRRRDRHRGRCSPEARSPKGGLRGGEPTVRGRAPDPLQPLADPRPDRCGRPGEGAPLLPERARRLLGGLPRGRHAGRGRGPLPGVHRRGHHVLRAPDAGSLRRGNHRPRRIRSRPAL